MNPQYINLLDMIDGGGAGRAGGRFQGGGILSALGNTMMRPAGYQNRMLENKNSTGRAITTAVQEMTGRRTGRSDRPISTPTDPAMPQPQMGGYDSPVGLDGDMLRFDQFLQDLRLKEQVYGLPRMSEADAAIMFDEYERRRIAQEMPAQPAMPTY